MSELQIDIKTTYKTTINLARLMRRLTFCVIAGGDLFNYQSDIKQLITVKNSAEMPGKSASQGSSH